MRGRTQLDGSTPREARHDYWGVVLEAPDGPELGRFYAELLGWTIENEAEDGWHDRAARRCRLHRVPER